MILHNQYQAIFIAYNSALHDLVLSILEKHNAKGYTEWESVAGRGSHSGVPHLGSHAWPTTNGAILVIVENERVNTILEALRNLDEENPKQGLRAFVWEVSDMI